MRRMVWMLAVASALVCASGARAQLTGLEVEGGVSAVGRGSSVTLPGGSSESHTGWRGVVRLGIGPLSAGAEMGARGDAAALPRYGGVFAAFHPLGILGLAPYVDVGVGRAFAAGESWAIDGGRAAWTYGAGAEFHLNHHWGVNAGVHVVREGHPAVNDIASADTPKTVSGLLAYRF